MIDFTSPRAIWQDLQTAKAENERIRSALDLAVNMIMQGEPGDSRAVSDEAVALAAVACGDTSPPVMKVIRAALALTRPELGRDL